MYNKKFYVFSVGFVVIFICLYIQYNKIEKFSSGAKEDIIIEQPDGGLGDNLAYTTLPELYSKLGHKVYISSKNAYRNNQIYDLVWKLNPYVEGISDSPQNAGLARGQAGSGEDQFIKRVELGHNLTNGYRKYPVIYYKPKYIYGIDKYIFYDTTAITTNPKPSHVRKSFESVFLKYPHMTPRRIEFTNIKNRIIPGLEHQAYKIKTIQEYCDLLYSCKIFVCGQSGSAVLASAVKQDNDSPEIFSFWDLEKYYCNTFKFDNQNNYGWIK
jgi:hypothetical protein